MIYLSIGTNLGNKKANIDYAVQLLKSLGMVKAISDYWSSDPWGFDSENGFINIAIAMASDKEPLEFLRLTKEIEIEMGRTKKSTDGYSDRIIDIDIIDYNGEIIDKEELILPHPHIAERKFVLFPLQEIAPEWKHPITGIRIKEIIENCKDDGNCTKGH